MKITKITSNIYDIEPLMLKWHITVGDFVSARKRLGISSEEYEQCFMCDEPFAENVYPAFVSVKGVGNMFICDKCMDYLMNNQKEDNK